MPVTLKQIAARTGLALPTVGNILGRGDRRYNEETRQRVLQAAREMGYQPNASARAIRRGRFGCVALVISRTGRFSDLPQLLIEGLDDELVQNGMHLTIARLPNEELQTTDFVPQVVRESLADGLIMNYTHGVPRHVLDLISLRKTPTVWVNCRLPSDCVHPDDYGAAREAVRRLVKLGHRRIAYLRFFTPPVGEEYGSFEQHISTDHYSTLDRQNGYADAMRAAGLAPRMVGADRFTPFAEYGPACRALLAGPDRPTAILTYELQDAETVMAVATGIGLGVPADLSVMTFHQRTWRRLVGMAVGAMQVPVDEQGRRAVRMLLRKIKSPAALPPEPVPFPFVPGDTVAAAPGTG